MHPPTANDANARIAPTHKLPYHPKAARETLMNGCPYSEERRALAAINAPTLKPTDAATTATCHAVVQPSSTIGSAISNTGNVADMQTKNDENTPDDHCRSLKVVASSGVVDDWRRMFCLFVDKE
jgi:hypothetical protein